MSVKKKSLSLKIISVFLSTIVIYCAPGLSAYQAAAQSFESANPAAHETGGLPPLTLPIDSLNAASSAGSGILKVNVDAGGLDAVPGGEIAAGTPGLGQRPIRIEDRDVISNISHEVPGIVSVAGSELSGVRIDVERAITASLESPVHIAHRSFSPAPYFRNFIRSFGFGSKDSDLAQPEVSEMGELQGRLGDQTIKLESSASTDGGASSSAEVPPPSPPTADKPGAPSGGNGGSNGAKNNKIGKPAWMFIVGELILQIGVEAFLATLPMMLQKQFHDVTNFVFLGLASAFTGMFGRWLSSVFKKKFGLAKTYWGALVLRGGVVAGIIWFLPHLTFPVLIAVYALHGFLFGVSITAETSIGPALVGQGNSALNRFLPIRQIWLEVIGMLGPIISGIVVAHTGFTYIQWLFPVLLFVTALYTRFTLRIPETENKLEDVHKQRLVKSGFEPKKAADFVLKSKEISSRLANFVKHRNKDSRIENFLLDDQLLAALLGVRPGTLLTWNDKFQGVDREEFPKIIKEINPEAEVLWDEVKSIQRAFVYIPASVVQSMREATALRQKEVSFSEELKILSEAGDQKQIVLERILRTMVSTFGLRGRKIQVIYGVPPTIVAKEIRVYQVQSSNPVFKIGKDLQQWAYRRNLGSVSISFGKNSSSPIYWEAKDVTHPENVRYAAQYKTAFEIASEAITGQKAPRIERKHVAVTPATYMDRSISPRLSVAVKHDPEEVKPTGPSEPEHKNIFKEIGDIFKEIGRKMKEGAAIVWKNPLLRLVLIAYTVYLMMNPILYFVSSVFCVRLLGSPEIAANAAGWIAGLYSAGGLIGGFWMLRQQGRIDRAVEAGAIDQAKADQLSNGWLVKWMKCGAFALSLLTIFAFPGMAWMHLPKALALAHISVQALLMIPFGVFQSNAVIKLTSLFMNKVPKGKMVEATGFQGAFSLVVINLLQLVLKFFFSHFSGFTPFHYFAYFLIPIGILSYFLAMRVKHQLASSPADLQ